jgi:hypothetical protein
MLTDVIASTAEVIQFKWEDVREQQISEDLEEGYCFPLRYCPAIRVATLKEIARNLSQDR